MDASPRPHITVVGLGPAGTAYLNDAVVALMAGSARCFVRTLQHPAAAELVSVTSFDALYESADSFEEVYRGIVESLVEAARANAPDPVVYAVPGSPLVAERTVELLRLDDRVEVTVIPALSFLDLAWDRLGIDPLSQGVRLVDAEQFSSHAAGATGPLLVAQCWSVALLSEVKLSAPSEEGAVLPSVTILHHLGLPDEVVLEVDWWELDRTIAPDHLTSLYLPAAPVGLATAAEMARLEDLVRTLRSECPWDREQTHGSLMPHLIEESYEVLDALSAMAADDGEPDPAHYAHLEEELGDLLFQVVFHARLAQEQGQFSLADVAKGVHDKLVHRHPHVFGDVTADTPDQVIGNWEAIKKKEKGRSSVTEGIPSSLPSLMLTSKMQRKARSVGLEPTRGDADISLWVAELRAAVAQADREDADAPLADDSALTEVAVGEILFEIADLARRAGVDPEHALRAQALRYRDVIVAAEQSAQPGA